MYVARVFVATVLISVQRELSFRADFVIRVLLTAVVAAGTIGTLAAVFTRVDRLHGWGYGDAVVVLGFFVVVNGVMQAFVEPNLAWFQAKIRSGALDDILLRPAPDAFLASLSTCRPFALVDVVIGAGITTYGLAVISATVTPAGVLASTVLLVLGVTVAWSLRFVLASMAFWAGGLELTVLFSAPWQLGRYPADMYGHTLRFVVTYVVPVAFVSTIPARALVHRPSLATLAAGAGVAAISATIALGVWRRGIRSYTSATS